MQSGNPAASGGLAALLVDAEPVVVDLVLVPLMLLPLVLVFGVALRTCLVTASQHLPEAAEVLGEVVVVEVCATAIPTLPASIAAATSPIPVVRMWRIPFLVSDSPALFRRDVGERRY